MRKNTSNIKRLPAKESSNIVNKRRSSKDASKIAVWDEHRSFQKARPNMKVAISHVYHQFSLVFDRKTERKIYRITFWLEYHWPCKMPALETRENTAFWLSSSVSFKLQTLIRSSKHNSSFYCISVFNQRGNDLNLRL